MLYDPLKEDALTFDFHGLDPISAYLAQTDTVELADKPATVFMEFDQGQIDGWIFEPLEGIVLGTCGSKSIVKPHKKRFDCDVPAMIFVLLLDGTCSLNFDQKPDNSLLMEKNMFSWGDWSDAQGITEIPAQEQYCHVSFSIRVDSFRKHFGNHTGERILSQLRQSLSHAGKDVTHISGLASPETIVAGRRLFNVPRSSHLDVLELKAASVEFVTKMMLNILDFKAPPTASFSHQDIAAIKVLKDRLESDISHSGNILELCSSIGMSRSKASTIFKHQYNTTIGKYQHTCRMAYAHKMLISRQRNVTECAYELGYTNIGHFIAAFRKYYGVTPGQVLSLGKVSSEQ